MSRSWMTKVTLFPVFLFFFNNSSIRLLHITLDVKSELPIAAPSDQLILCADNYTVLATAFLGFQGGNWELSLLGKADFSGKYGPDRN
jgi:hypothetical protein